MSPTPETHTILVNGEKREIRIGQTVADVLRLLDIDPMFTKGIAVAVNDEVVRNQGWDDVALEAGDRVEIITARQGG